LTLAARGTRHHGESLVLRGFYRIFHNSEAIADAPLRSRILARIAETRVRRGVRAKLQNAFAPIPVTLLWTGCTRLKTRELQAAIFH